MKKILYTIGDSWTYGYDLENPETECYPYLLSKKLDCDLVNEGLPAASNDWMFRKSIEWIIKNDISKLEFLTGKSRESFNSSEISLILIESFPLYFAASSNMTLQKGQAAATVSTP